MASGDVIINASATVIVGILFLVSLRKALGFQPTGRFLQIIAAVVAMFSGAAMLALAEDEITWALRAAKIFTLFGFFGVTMVVYYLAREVEEKEKRIR
jgi:Ca2+/Na+ antiporter